MKNPIAKDKLSYWGKKLKNFNKVRRFRQPTAIQRERDEELRWRKGFSTKHTT